jgi:hypothetical protein
VEPVANTSQSYVWAALSRSVTLRLTVSTAVTSSRSTSTFRALRSAARIGAATSAGDSIAVATW